MVDAILRFVEYDGTVLPPRPVKIVGPCPTHRGGCIEVATVQGDPMFVRPDELEADDLPE